MKNKRVQVVRDQVSMGSSILDTTSESLLASDCSGVVEEGALLLGAADGFESSTFDCRTLWNCNLSQVTHH